MSKKLPKISHPLFELPYPSKNKTVKARRFLVKEEKILLMAGESESDKDITLAIKQVLNNCIVDPDFNIEDLTIFDLEMMFLKLRAVSVNNIIEVAYRDLEDNKVYKFKIDLDEVILKQNSELNKRIEIDDTTGIIMKYPSVSLIEDAPENLNATELVEYLIRNCIDQIYTDEDVYFASDYTDEELNEFIDHLEPQVFQKIRDYFDNIPQLFHEIKYKNELGNERTITFTTLNDFFTWG